MEEMVRRHELEDSEWELVRDVVAPQRPGKGRRIEDPRRLLDGMMWILRTGAPWRDLPRRYGPWQTVYHHFSAWRREGVIDKVLQELQLRLDENGFIEWDLWCVDGSTIRASRVAAGGGKKGAP